MAAAFSDMTPHAIARMKGLTLSGALPFYGALFLLFFPVGSLDAASIALSYGTLIIAFLCGTHWGFYVLRSSDAPFDLLIISNVVTLVAWAAPFLLPYVGAVLLHSACFLILLWIDGSLSKAGLLPAWYFTLRKTVTALVIVAELILAAAFFASRGFAFL